MHDRAFVAELKSWMRFNDDEAMRTGDGLFSRTTGNPSVPRWIGSPFFPLLFRANSENDKYARHVRSSAGIAVFVTEGAPPHNGLPPGAAMNGLRCRPSHWVSAPHTSINQWRLPPYVVPSHTFSESAIVVPI